MIDKHKYLLFNVWDKPFRSATIWYCFAEDDHCETRESDWKPIYDDDPRFTILKSLSGWLEASTKYYSFKRYAITTEEYEVITGVTS